MPRPAEYDDEVYAVTKAYSIRGTLLDRVFFRLASGFTSVEELAERLRSTRYAQCLGKERISRAKDLEKALVRGLIDLHYRLMRLYSIDGVLTALFGRYTSWDVKAILKGKAAGQGHEQILEGLYMRAEELLGRRDLVARAAAARDLGGAVMGLSGTEYYGVAQEGLKLYEATGDPVSFDIVVDRFTVYGIARAAKGAGEDEDTYVGKIVLSMVDEYNLGVALRHSSIGIPTAQASQLLLTEGNLYLPAESLRRLMSESAPPSSYADLLRRTPYGAYLKEADVNSILGSVASFRLHVADAAWSGNAMEPSVLVALIVLVENEVRNLSAVAFGIENKVPKDEIYALLRFPE